MTGFRRCGKRWASKEAALRSKKALRGNYMAIDCRCGGVHLQPLVLAPLPPRKPAKDTGPDAATRALVLTRDGHACVCCGRSIVGQVYSLQHRKRRSQGGDNSPCNLITVLGDGTSGCHARIDSRQDPHDAARGYTCQSWEDPASVPVMYFDESGCGVTFYLEADGGLTVDAPVGAA